MSMLFGRGKLFYNQLRQAHRSVIASNNEPVYNIGSEKKAFEEVLPEVIDTILTGPKLNEVPEVGSWIKQLLNYTMEGGRLYRGVTVSYGYRMLEDPEYYSEETQHLARVLGWCLEMLQTYFLSIDDVVDNATTRRGKLCWHRLPNIGYSPMKDYSLMYQCLMELIDIKFGKTPFYMDWIKLFNEATYVTLIGEQLDCSSDYNRENNNIDTFNFDHYNTIAIHKNSFYSFQLPIFLALILTKNGKVQAPEELKYICVELGRFIQLQNDYQDVYSDETVTGKTPTDIQEGKCTWVSVTALQHCNEAQRSIFKEYYGSKDPEHVKQIKQLYDELNLPQLYEKCERIMYDNLVCRINALPTENERKLLFEIFNLYYIRLY